jgi:aspartate carbamoyltransferase regulatory subunit
MKNKISREKTLAVSAIRNGTVIDHIHAGQALKIVDLLHLAKHHKQVTLGLNLPSKSLQYKDIIKVEDREISDNEASQLAIISPQATINIIKEYKVAKKYQVFLPDTISSIVCCPNPRCITNHEPMKGSFIVKQQINKIFLQCKFCRKRFLQNLIADKLCAQ